MDTVNPFLKIRARWLAAWGLAGLALTILAQRAAENVLRLDGESVTNLGLAFIYLWMLYAVHRESTRCGFALRNFVKDGKVTGIPKLVGLVILLFLCSAGVIVLTSYLWPTLLESGWWRPAIVGPDSSILNKALFALTGIVVAPVVEEIFFRGILLGRWTTRWGIRAGMLMSAIAFAIIHLDTLAAFVFGLCMSVIYLKSRTLFSPIVTHALYNAVIVATHFFPPSPVSRQETHTSQESPSATVGAVVLLVISLPLLAVFIYRNWPGKDDVTPGMKNARLPLESPSTEGPL